MQIMSIDATIWAWSKNLKATQKLVLLSLADRADERHRCWPSLRRLAGDTNLDERTVNAALREMCALGLISRVQISGRGYVYTLEGVQGRETAFAKNTGYKGCTPCSGRTPHNACPPTPLTGCTPPPSSSEGTPPSLDAPLIFQESSNNRSEKRERARTRVNSSEKSSYGEFGRVRLTAEEHGKLVAEYGAEQTALAVNRLDSYLAAKGERYLSHYAAMRNWVFQALREDRERASPGGRPPGKGQSFKTFAELAEERIWAEFEDKMRAREADRDIARDANDLKAANTEDDGNFQPEGDS